MNILIAGASGFIGKELVNALSQSHQLTALGRDIKHLQSCFRGSISLVTWDTLNNCDATQFDIVINLSGSNIGAKRWTRLVKKELIDSRVLSNEKLIDWLIKQKAAPHFFCANAVGIYGAQTDSSPFDEATTLTFASDDFLKQIGFAWEQSLQPAIDAGIKVTTLRFGVVLKKGEGMLKKLEYPFLLGLGNILGEGNQIISWIHYQDVIEAIRFAIGQPTVTGPINITAPNPVSQKDFATCFAQVLKRPLFLKMPSFLIRALFGEMGDYLLLKGQWVTPRRLIELGFKFKYPNLLDALKEEYQK